MELDEGTLELIVRAVAKRLAAEARPAEEPWASATPCGGETGHSCTADPRPVHSVKDPVFEALLPRLVALTPSQVAVGRAGNRFRTDLYLRTREGHADARDAVHSEVPPEWAAQQGLLALRTRCSDRREYLLYPNQGRRLCDDSVAALEAQRRGKPDVLLVVGDGLSPNAVLQNGAVTLAALRQAFSAEGWSTGPECYVQFARIGVADELGVRTGARATVILVGERPGLGAGDSLSVYLAVNPRLEQDNAEKNCISNVRPIGIAPQEAAGLAVQILRRSFERGVGGVALGLGWGRQ